jgi:RimJ/RimL family protein N-acetyltransferase
MAIRLAEPADCAFIRQIAGRAENTAFISDDNEQVLRSYIAAPEFSLVIWDRDGVPAGFALFHGCHDAAMPIELRRLAIDVTDGGQGGHFVRELTDFAFEQLGAHKLWLDAASFNKRAQKVYDRAGFTREGLLRQHWRNPKGDYVDLVMFGMLRDEWQALVSARL